LNRRNPAPPLGSRRIVRFHWRPLLSAAARADWRMGAPSAVATAGAETLCIEQYIAGVSRGVVGPLRAA
jgi:hypothetical protein